MDPSVISITAHYTAYAWKEAGVEASEHFVTAPGRWLYGLGRVAFGPARLFGLRSPLESFLIPRHKTLDHLAREAGPRQFLEIAAGLSPRGLAFSADPSVRYVEADLPDMIARKRAICERVAKRPNHFFEAVDLMKDDLSRLASIRRGEPTVVITEGLANYFPGEVYQAMLREIAAFLRAQGGGVYLTDMHDRRSEAQYGAFSRYFRAVVGMIARTPTHLHVADPEDGRRIFLAAGFDRFEAIAPRDYARELGFEAEKRRDPVWIYRAEVAPA